MAVPTAKPKSSPKRKHPARSGNTKLLTLQTASAESGVPYSSLYDLAKRGVLPFVKFPGMDRIWIKRTDLEALIERSVERERP